jgi:TonB family protein
MRAVVAIGEEPRSWKPWLLALLTALLFHVLLLAQHFHWADPTTPPRIEVQQVDPKKLEAIKRQWQQQAKNTPKQLLLDKNKNAPSEKEAPKDARYESDRNIRVEKEQRARETNVIPIPRQAIEGAQKSQSSQAKQQSKQAEHESKAEKASKVHPLPSLGSLGIPFHLERPAKKKQEVAQADPEEAKPAERPWQPGGDQALNDRALPEGNENLLNTQESVYYSFYARIYETIGPIWQSIIHEIPSQRRLMQGEYSTVVDVVFDREGNLVAVRRMHASGIPEFDAAVDAAWKRAPRFPNPPTGLLNEAGEVHTGWTFTVNVGNGFNFMPPTRNY